MNKKLLIDEWAIRISKNLTEDEIADLVDFLDFLLENDDVVELVYALNEKVKRNENS